MGTKDQDRTKERLNLEQRVAGLVQLGAVMKALGTSVEWPGHSCGLNEAEFEDMGSTIRQATGANAWFTETNIRNSLNAWGEEFTAINIKQWLNQYATPLNSIRPIRRVGLVLAGNIPLVGFHDIISVWLSGHSATVKCSSQDSVLIPALIGVLDRFVPGALSQISFTTGRWGKVDAVIATGSNNSTRYFEHYFGHLPHIFRKSRTSVAVLDGSETEEDLAGLSEDIFRYFGMGCRNVNKLYLPKDFELDRLFKAFFPWSDIVNNNKYANNYDYTRALWLLDKVDFLDNGFVLVKEDGSFNSPVGTVFYERYSERATVEEDLHTNAGSIQCIVGKGYLPFGTTQKPGLADYADGVDTMSFLHSL